MVSAARLIVDSALAGSWNMSVDQSILESSSHNEQVTLRFYQWKPATVSLGYFQKIESRKHHGPSLDCPLVRRSTGGGAIVHDHELTYSLCVPGDNEWAKDNQQLYALVHEALIECLSDWQVSASQVPETIKMPADPFLCFQRRSVGDVVLDGEKICGSAQRRVEKSILQHGSILLKRSEAAPELPGVCDLSENQVRLEQLSNALLARLESRMSLQFEIQELTASEHHRAEEIQNQRFLADRWTAKR